MQSLHQSCPANLRAAAEQLLPVLYADLKRVARNERRRHLSPETMNTTALVHDAYLRLSRDSKFESHAHFLRVAAVTIRHLLIDRARAQIAAKRGGGATHVELDEAQDFHVEHDAQVVALHEALEKLAAESPRLAAIVECRVFGGYEEKEIAEALELSPRTVSRDWTLARAWLRRELGEFDRRIF